MRVARSQPEKLFTRLPEASNSVPRRLGSHFQEYSTRARCGLIMVTLATSTSLRSANGTTYVTVPSRLLAFCTPLMVLNTFSPAGENVLSTIKGVQKASNRDGTVTYVVPLAERKLVDVASVTMIKPHLARVEYSWKWEPNRLGTAFDASGSLVKSFSGWDRATLIKTYGADFYGAPPTKASIVLMELDNGTWKPYVE